MPGIFNLLHCNLYNHTFGPHKLLLSWLFFSLIGLSTASASDFSAPTSYSSPYSIGPQQTLVIMATFEDTTTMSVELRYPTDQMAQIMETVNRYYKENSYGKMWLTGVQNPDLPADILGWLHIPMTDPCTTPARTDAMIDAVDHLVDFTQYKKVILIAPSKNTVIGCGFFPQAQIQPEMRVTQDGIVPLSLIWSSTAHIKLERTFVMAHEYGHTIGLAHASSYSCKTFPVSDFDRNCTFIEYGDRYSTMGSTTALTHLSAAHKDYLGWLDDTHIKTITKSGEYTLAPIESLSSQLKAIRLLRRPADSFSEADHLYVSYHQPIAEFPRNPVLFNLIYQGALLHVTSRLDNGTIQLPSASVDDFSSSITLAPNESFRDPATGTTVTVSSLDSTAMAINVQIGKTNFITPSATIIAPQNLSSVTNIFTISATASDDGDISRVHFYWREGGISSVRRTRQWIATLNTPPYSLAFDSLDFPNGQPKTLEVCAEDTAGDAFEAPNNISCDRVEVHPDNPAGAHYPDINWVLPNSNAENLRFTTTTQLEITDDEGIDTVVLMLGDHLLGNALLDANTPNRYILSWDSRDFENGSHQLRVGVTDSFGNHIVDSREVNIVNPELQFQLAKDATTWKQASNRTIRWTTTNFPFISSVSFSLVNDAGATTVLATNISHRNNSIDVVIPESLLPGSYWLEASALFFGRPPIHFSSHHPDPITVYNPVAVSALSGRTKANKVNLIWEAPIGAQSFDVYRRLNTEVDFMRISTVIMSVAVDFIPVSITSAEYYIVAVFENQPGPVSEIISLSPTIRTRNR